jgi:hypothetical protein
MSSLSKDFFNLFFFVNFKLFKTNQLKKKKKKKKKTVNHLDHFAVYGPSDSVRLRVFLAVIKI